ncbi:unnamed protein product [Phyllotreta striolata]|uniref:Membrane protein FAM174-like n=1 Tax=Phyllotreta striolata TaxID=444603 RepID=A0A9N9XTH3_PHYSR|nr:unnamed protein product [Phyllotreta striolata]
MKLKMGYQMYILLAICVSMGHFVASSEDTNEKTDKTAKEGDAKALPGSVKKDLKEPNATVTNKTTNSTKSTVKPKEIDKDKLPENGSVQIESGAVIRGVLVLIGISMVFFVYLGCKTYRRRKMNVMVRKYGVRTRRSDLEMRPLPLDDDEDDETVFDVGNINKN